MDKVRKFDFKFKIPFTTKEVWSLIFENYGGVADYSNGLTASELLGGCFKAEEGIERICYLDKGGRKFLKEQLRQVNRGEMSFTNVITAVKGVPLMPEMSKTAMKLKELPENACELEVSVYMRTKPSFLARFLKSVSKSQMSAFALGITHYLTTNEVVTKDNFRKIAKQYPAPNDKHGKGD